MSTELVFGTPEFERAFNHWLTVTAVDVRDEEPTDFPVEEQWDFTREDDLLEESFAKA